MMQRLKMVIQIPVICRRDAATSLWVAGCQQLDVFSQGETQDEAMAAVTSALTSFVEICYDRGILDNTLLDCGFRRLQPANGHGTPDSWPAPDDDLARQVPIELLMGGQRSSGFGANACQH